MMGDEKSSAMGIRRCGNFRVFLCIALVAAFHIGTTSSFVFTPTQTYLHQLSSQKQQNQPQGTPTASTSLYGATRDDDGRSCDKNGDKTTHDFHVIASDDVILPGEQTSISLSDYDAIPLIQASIQDDKPMLRVVVAVRVSTTTKDDDEDTTELNIAQVASLCEMPVDSIKVEDDRVHIDLKCVGRVRLLDMTKQYNSNFFKFSGTWIEEGFQGPKELEKAKQLECNIERIMLEVSAMEKEIETRRLKRGLLLLDDSLSRKQGKNMYEEYSQHKDRLFRMVATAFDLQAEIRQGNNNCNVMVSGNKDGTTTSLTATSWAVFPCIHDPSLEARYRLRALDWDNILERIKLAQYVLREKRLLLQGELLELQDDPPPENYYNESEDAFQ